MRAYSEDLRRKIVEAIERGMPKAQAAHLFGVSLSSVKRYVRIVQQGHSLAPKKVPGRPQRIGEGLQRLLQEDIKGRPAATIADRRRFLECLTNTHLSDSTVRRLLKRLGFSRKKGLRRRWKEMSG
jgi:transposase